MELISTLVASINILLYFEDFVNVDRIISAFLGGTCVLKLSGQIGLLAVNF